MIFHTPDGSEITKQSFIAATKQEHARFFLFALNPGTKLK